MSVTLNEDRGVCKFSTTEDIDSQCNNEHKAYMLGADKVVFNHCIPVPDDDDKYYVVSKTVDMTCEGGGTESVTFEYLNATKCTCRHLGQFDYDINS